MYCQRILHQLLLGFLRPALHLVAAHRVHRLRRQSYVGHYGYAGLRDSPDTVGIFRAALQLHGLTACLLHDASSIEYGIAHRGLVRHKRHVDHHEGFLHAATNGSAVMYHVLNSYGKRVLITQDDISQ